MLLINPFIPHHPSAAANFVGRRGELRRLQASLLHAKARKPINFMLTGERGIGKTSLLNYVQSMAQGNTGVDGASFNFLVITVQIDRRSCLIDVLRKVEAALRKELDRTEIARKFLVNSWAFLRRLEIAGISLKEDAHKPSILWEEFADTLAQTVRRVCRVNEPDTLLPHAEYDGLLLLFDEVDTANEELDFGAFVKHLTEYLQRHGCREIVIGLSGLPTMVDVIIESHPSALRVFEELRLSRLPRAEVQELVHSFLLTAHADNSLDFDMTPAAFDLVMELSDGHPHFVQQLCYSGFNAMMERIAGSLTESVEEEILTRVTIHREDVAHGAFAKRGATNVIGDIYYRHMIKPDHLHGLQLGIISFLSQHPGKQIEISDIASELGCDVAEVREWLLGLIASGVLTPLNQRGETGLAHTCLAFWMQSMGYGNQITLGADSVM